MPKAKDPQIDFYLETATALAIFRARCNPRILRWLEAIEPDPPESPTKHHKKRPRDTVSDGGGPCSDDDNLEELSPVYCPAVQTMPSAKQERKLQKTKPNSDVTGGVTNTHSNVTDGKIVRDSTNVTAS